MSKVKVQLRVPTKGHKRGDIIEVDSTEIAEQLIRDRQAIGMSKAAKELEAEILGTADAPKGK